KRKMVILTQSEFAVLLHFLPEQWRPLVLWLAGTGMRWGEATALTWGDLDRDARPRLVHIDKAWQKPEIGTKPVLGPPKTDAGERTISLPARLRRTAQARASRRGVAEAGDRHQASARPAEDRRG